MTEISKHIPTRMPTTNRPGNLGIAMDDDAGRLDSVAKVTGRAKFGRDVYPKGALFVSFIRCPYGNAELVDTDLDTARAVEGVVEIVLERQAGQYHGQPVGYLVAESKLAMQRGLQALAPGWERKPTVTGIGDDPPPAVNNPTQAILDAAEHVLEAEYSTVVQTHSPLETHGCSIDYRDGEAVVYASTQGTFGFRDGLDEALGLSRSQYKVSCEYIGGGFGSKLNGAGKEGVTAARVAAQYGRPTYLFVDRAEDHLDTGNRPSSRTSVKVGFRSDGTITGGRIQTWGGVGVGGGGGGVRFPSGRYELGGIQRDHQDVAFAGGAPRPFRAPGSPQGAFAEELMLDEVAAIAGVDPLELRLRLETSDARREMYEIGANRIGWTDRVRNGSQTGVIRRGFGVGSASWGRFPSTAEAEVVVNRDGSVEVRTGTQDIGTGQRSVMGVTAATTLGVPLEIVRVRIGDSTLPIGPASGGSVTAHNTVPAMTSAAADVRTQLLEHLADANGVDPGTIAIVDGRIERDGRAWKTWAEACGTLPDGGLTGRGRWDRRTRRADDSTGHSHGVQFVDLEVDTATGVVAVKHIVAVQACGRVVYRKGAESQIIGGVIQGLSYALFENKLLDRQTGTMVNPNFDMYKIAGTADMPHIEPVLWAKGGTGVRSLGEPPTIPTAGAIACAVFNAIGHPVRHLPLTPDKVLAALEGGRA